MIIAILCMNNLLEAFFSIQSEIPPTVAKKNPKQGRYSQWSAMVAFMGTIFAIGINDTKNQVKPKNTIFDFLLILYIKIAIAINMIIETKVLG